MGFSCVSSHTDGYQQKLRAVWRSGVSWREAFTRSAIGFGLLGLIYKAL